MAILFGFLRSPRNSVEGYLGGHTGHREGDAGEERMNQGDTYSPAIPSNAGS